MISGCIQGPSHVGTLQVYKCTCSGQSLLNSPLDHTVSTITFCASMNLCPWLRQRKKTIDSNSLSPSNSCLYTDKLAARGFNNKLRKTLRNKFHEHNFNLAYKKSKTRFSKATKTVLKTLSPVGWRERWRPRDGERPPLTALGSPCRLCWMNTKGVVLACAAEPVSSQHGVARSMGSAGEPTERTRTPAGTESTAVVCQTTEWHI